MLVSANETPSVAMNESMPVTVTISASRAAAPAAPARSRRLRLLLDPERELEDVANRAVIALEHAERASAAEDEDPVGDLDHLLELRGREQDREPVCGEPVDDPEDLRL